MCGFSARCSASIEHSLPRLRCEEISAQDGRLILDSKPTVPITLQLVECGMRPNEDPVGSIPAELRFTVIGCQGVQKTLACGASWVYSHHEGRTHVIGMAHRHGLLGAIASEPAVNQPVWM